jgi:lipid II isoglutaminyl synthase (glutamine-hydrolysing)
MKSVVVAHLYPREMNIYGDLGNIITLRRRMEWRGYTVQVRAVEIGKRFDFAEVDLVFGGGGQDSGQLVMGQDLLERGEELRQMAEDGVPMLAICGTYQLFGRGFTTIEGQDLPGIGVFGASTLGSTVRMIGNITVRSQFGDLVGFENHSGQTVLENAQQPLGRVTKGFGNNPKSGLEGAISRNAIGTYMHGPLLPKNPALADHLIQVALERRYGKVELEPLDDSLSQVAARVAKSRPQ